MLGAISTFVAVGAMAGAGAASAGQPMLIDCAPSRTAERFTWLLMPTVSRPQPSGAHPYSRLVSAVLGAHDAEAVGIDLDGRFLWRSNDTASEMRFPLLPDGGGTLRSAFGAPPGGDGIISQGATHAWWIEDGEFIKTMGGIDELEVVLARGLPSTPGCKVHIATSAVGALTAHVPADPREATVVHLPAPMPPPAPFRAVHGAPVGGTSSTPPSAVWTLTTSPLDLRNALARIVPGPPQPDISPHELPLRLLPGATIAQFGHVDDARWVVRVPVAPHRGGTLRPARVLRWVERRATSMGVPVERFGTQGLRMRLPDRTVVLVVQPAHIIVGDEPVGVLEAAVGLGETWPLPEFANTHPIAVSMGPGGVRGCVEPIGVEAGLRGLNNRWSVAGRIDGPPAARRACAFALAAWDRNNLLEGMRYLVDGAVD